jgi:hypothetical protein
MLLEFYQLVVDHGNEQDVRKIQFSGFRRRLPHSQTTSHTKMSNNIRHRTNATTATTSLQSRTFTQTTLFVSHSNTNVTSYTRERPTSTRDGNHSGLYNPGSTPSSMTTTHLKPTTKNNSTSHPSLSLSIL